MTVRPGPAAADDEAGTACCCCARATVVAVNCARRPASLALPSALTIGTTIARCSARDGFGWFIQRLQASSVVNEVSRCEWFVVGPVSFLPWFVPDQEQKAAVGFDRGECESPYLILCA
jgi:hypothetical protein